MLILGLLLIFVVLVDVVITTLTVGGGGPLTNRLLSRMWRLALKLHRKHTNHRMLFLVSWLLLVVTACCWFLLVLLGWCLIFNSSHQAIINASTGDPATVWERIYFVSYTLSTLGLGDFKPQAPVWQIATAAASMSGFMLITLVIAYLLPVVSAATQKRQLALYISSLGGTPDEIVARAWNGENFGQLSQHLIVLTSQITLQSEQHLTYPILYYFHSMQRSRSLSLSLVALDEALTLLRYGVKPAIRPDPATLDPLRRASSAFLQTLLSVYIQPCENVPPIPSLEALRASGIPTVSDREFQSAIQSLQQRRQLLLTLASEDGWNWDAVRSMRTTNRATDLDDGNSIQEITLY